MTADDELKVAALEQAVKFFGGRTAAPSQVKEAAELFYGFLSGRVQQ